MRPYSYVKLDTESNFIQQHIQLERGRKILAGSFVMIGLSLLTYVGGYYSLWQVKKSTLAQKSGIIDTLALAPQSAFSESLATENSLNDSDSAAASSQQDSSAFYDTFTISIPELEISRAKVTTNVMSDNRDIYQPILTSSLAHYKGTAYPGEEGNVLIYGHSILPAFYNPRNYLSIFSRLDQLKANDAIRVTWGDNVYTYRVEGMSVVSPNDVRVLRYKNGKTITLLTCVPPGLTTERLLVFGRME
jgi:sortase A